MLNHISTVHGATLISYNIKTLTGMTLTILQWHLSRGGLYKTACIVGSWNWSAKTVHIKAQIAIASGQVITKTSCRMFQVCSGKFLPKLITRWAPNSHWCEVMGTHYIIFILCGWSVMCVSHLPGEEGELAEAVWCSAGKSLVLTLMWILLWHEPPIWILYTLS